MLMNKKTHFSAHVVLFFVVFSWSLNTIMMKIGFREIDPWMFGLLRLAAIAPVVLLAARFSPGYIPFEKKDFLKITGIACIGFAGFQIFFLPGINGVSAPVGGMLLGILPVWVVVINLIARTDKVSTMALAGVLLTIAGITLIAYSPGAAGGNSGETTVSGVLFLVLAEFFFAINTVFLRPFMKKYSIPQVTSIAIIVSFIIYAAILNKRIVTFDYSSLSLVTWGTILYSGFVALFIANVFWNRSVKHMGSTKVSVYANLPPVFVLILGAVFLGELLRGPQYAGAAIIAAGIILVQLQNKR